MSTNMAFKRKRYLRSKRRKSHRKRIRRRGRGLADFITPKNVTNALQVGSLLYSIKKAWKGKKTKTPPVPVVTKPANPYMPPDKVFEVY